MARTALFVLAFGLLAAAAVMAEVSDDQLDEINSRLAKCVYEVPKISDFNRPSDTCRFEGIGAVNEGANKQGVINAVISCLKKRGVKTSIVASVQACISGSLSESLFA